MHWSDRYVGLPYIPESGDCAALAARVASEVLRIDCALPTAHATTLRDQAKQIMDCRDSLAIRVAHPVDAHPALFVGRGRTCHIGVVCVIDSQVWVLHADQGAGFVVRERLQSMTQPHRFRLEGFYKWL
ncbi:hypothetical protein CAL13_08905 [Bordetella genomosp. 9]|uniref:NlpC/P60 domain-containing protein n=1 Tax=Bordetella genomosp. 9 TaxID=1416803 RepID=A0A1W6YZC2_9BORD|nr:hypothetical protein CAL13_08905 [Bordetella genomosp. 9]